MMKNIVAGIFAHVDAGKTTLSESMLYKSGAIRNAGRVDNGSTFLDTYALEKQRGITIFSKQAKLVWHDVDITLLDTPGHVDFSAEMERTLSVIDYAILLISGSEGVQGHTETLWKLFKRYNKPIFIFVNKMDMNGTDKTQIMHNITNKLSDACIDFSKTDSEESDMQNTKGENSDATNLMMESIAMCDEKMMETYLEKGYVEEQQIAKAILDRKIFPCFFGSALKMTGIEEFMNGIDRYAIAPKYGEELSAIVYKISRDTAGNRLTHLKVTGGTLHVKEYLEKYDEKINQIRIYSGEKFGVTAEIAAGEICALTGLDKSRAGDIIGKGISELPVLEPVMTYNLILEEGTNASDLYKKILILEEELPELNVEWHDGIQIKVMGEVQTEIIKNIVKERFNTDIEFGTGRIVYKETIRNIVEGVGHFEPLRHYAEVQLRLEPGERGSGITISSECSEDVLAKNWQRLIFTHLEEKQYVGVMTGSFITDIHIILTGGRAHNKHTEGGDFRQATYRAVRQGLMQADVQLLEPYYDFELRIPFDMVGRAMTDLEKMSAHIEIPENNGVEAVIIGYCPVQSMQEYALTVKTYTKGRGELTCRFKGYFECHNQEEVAESIGYIAEADVANTADSVFCAHGAGYIVPWYEAPEHMHVPSNLHGRAEENDSGERNTAGYSLGSFARESVPADGRRKMAAGTESSRRDMEDNRDGYEKDRELEEIFNRTFGTKNTDNKKKHAMFRKHRGKVYDATDKPYIYKPKKHEDRYLLVDGYNIIFAWEELKELAEDNLDAARDRLLDIMSNYQGYMKINTMVVFDAYKVKGFKGEMTKYNNLIVVFTREAETADQYIEKFAHANGKKYDVTVATSDGLEQIIITGQGCNLLSARELKLEIDKVNEKIREVIAGKEKLMNYNQRM